MRNNSNTNSTVFKGAYQITIMSTELQFRVLRLLQSNPNLSQRELSKSLDVSLGGINYCLNTLISKGSIKIQNFKNNQNKWVYAYLITPQDIAEKTALTTGFLRCKMQEYQRLKEEIVALSQEALLAKDKIKDGLTAEAKKVLTDNYVLSA